MRDGEAERSFIWRSLLHHGLRAGPRYLFGQPRTPDSVRSSYDASRKELLDQLERLDWDSYTRFPSDVEDFVLLDDQVEWQPLRTPRTRLLDRLIALVRVHARPGATVVEFGSGDGRNLLVLQREFPEMSFVGLELSPTSVELARRAAQKFAVPKVRFEIANVCEPLPALSPRQDVVLAFSSHALEMMPRIFGRAVENMARCSSDGLLFFEPAPELWSWDLRGVAARCRVLQMDRLRGLLPTIAKLVKSKEWMMMGCDRTRVGLNPLNETCEIHLRRSTPVRRNQ